MSIFFAVLVSLGGLLLIWVFSEALVEFSIRLGIRLGLSTLIVGVVIVGFGTSLPELAVSGLAAPSDLSLAINNIIGSNATNLSLSLGIPLLIVRNLKLFSHGVKYLAMISISAMLLFSLAVVPGHWNFERYEGIILLCLLPLSIWALYRASKLDIRESPRATSEISKIIGEPGWMEKIVNSFIATSKNTDIKNIRKIEAQNESMPRIFIGVLLGLVGVIGGAVILVSGVEDLAAELGIATGFLGLTLVALGTSTPEIIVGIQSARKGEISLFVGNLFGSNVLHSLFVAGIVGIVGSGTVQDKYIEVVVLLMMVVSVVCGIFVTRKSPSRKTSTLFLILLLLLWGTMIGFSAVGAGATGM